MAKDRFVKRRQIAHPDMLEGVIAGDRCRSAETESRNAEESRRTTAKQVVDRKKTKLDTVAKIHTADGEPGEFHI